MKNVLLVFFLGISVQLLAQKGNADCTPDPSLIIPGYSPQNLKSGDEGEDYKEEVSFLFPKDTTINIFGNEQTIPIDSFKILSISNMPAGLSYDCNKKRCSYAGGGKGCLEISGTLGQNTAGNYNVEVRIAGYVQNPITSQTIEEIITQVFDFQVTGRKQICDIDSIPYTGVKPDEFPIAFVDSTYSLSPTYKFPDDTTIVIQGQSTVMPFDSFVISRIDNLPQSFSFECDRDDCKYSGGAYGCGVIEGNPTIEDTGIYNVRFTVQAYATIPTLNLPFNETLMVGRVLEIKQNIGIGKAETSQSKISNPDLNVFPNPAGSELHFKLFVPAEKEYRLLIIDPSGKIVLENISTLKEGLNIEKTDISELNPGVYIIQLQTDDRIFQKRLVKN